MRLHRFFTEFNYNDSEVIIHDSELTHQLVNVFRMKKGDRLILCDGALHEVTTEIEEFGKDFFQAKVIERATNKNEPTIRVVLYCAVLKREHFEMVVEKAVECGVSEIVPMITERTIKSGLNLERLQKIAKEAAEQSGRGIIPIVHDIVLFEAALRDAKKNSENIIFDFGGDPLSSTEPAIKRTVGIFIGPEGGFSPEEVKNAEENDILIRSLGARTLRGETAAIIATYLVTREGFALS